MIRGNQDGTFVDTGLLRDHVSRLREQKKTARALYDNVAAMKRCSDPLEAAQYNPVLRDIERLIEYFDRMARVLSDAGDDAVRMSEMLGGMIEDQTAQTYHISSRTFML